jgi:hypothetical protein
LRKAITIFVIDLLVLPTKILRTISIDKFTISGAILSRDYNGTKFLQYNSLKRCQHQMQSQNLSFQQLSSTIGGARLHAFCGKPKPCILFFKKFRVSLRSGNLLHGIITELRSKRIFMVVVLYFLSLPLTGFNAFVRLSTILRRRSKINLIRSVCTALLRKDKEQAENIHHGTVPFLPTEPSRQSGTETPAPGAARETGE